MLECWMERALRPALSGGSGWNRQAATGMRWQTGICGLGRTIGQECGADCRWILNAAAEETVERWSLMTLRSCTVTCYNSISMVNEWSRKEHTEESTGTCNRL